MRAFSPVHTEAFDKILVLVRFERLRCKEHFGVVFVEYYNFFDRARRQYFGEKFLLRYFLRRGVRTVKIFYAEYGQHYQRRYPPEAQRGTAATYCRFFVFHFDGFEKKFLRREVSATILSE